MHLTLHLKGSETIIEQPASTQKHITHLYNHQQQPWHTLADRRRSAHSLALQCAANLAECLSLYPHSKQLNRQGLSDQSFDLFKQY